MYGCRWRAYIQLLKAAEDDMQPTATICKLGGRLGERHARARCYFNHGPLAPIDPEAHWRASLIAEHKGGHGEDRSVVVVAHRHGRRCGCRCSEALDSHQGANEGSRDVDLHRAQAAHIDLVSHQINQHVETCAR